VGLFTGKQHQFNDRNPCGQTSQGFYEHYRKRSGINDTALKRESSTTILTNQLATMNK
jgi:hypothetical protein